MDEPMATRPVIRIGDWYAYDALGFLNFLPNLIERIGLDGTLRQKQIRDFEGKTHTALAPLETQPYHSGRRVLTITGIDASVVVNGLLSP